MTDEQIASEECRCLTAHAQFIGSGDVWIEGVNDFARAIESAACAPLLERIAELTTECANLRSAMRGLEATLAQRVPDGWTLVPVEPTDEQAMAIAGEIFPMSQLTNAAAYHARLCEVYGIGKGV